MSRKKTLTRKILINKPKNGEWKNPLCPQKWSYGIPKENPIMSASGKIEHSIERDQKWSGTSLGVNAIPAATATAVCEIIEGTISFLCMIDHRLGAQQLGALTKSGKTLR